MRECDIFPGTGLPVLVSLFLFCHFVYANFLRTHRAGLPGPVAPFYDALASFIAPFLFRLPLDCRSLRVLKLEPIR
jgi:hypothetical protein